MNKLRHKELCGVSTSYLIVALVAQ